MAPGGSLRVTVAYTPAVVDRVSVDYLSLKYRGLENVTQLKMTGNCLGRGHTETHSYSLLGKTTVIVYKKYFSL